MNDDLILDVAKRAGILSLVIIGLMKIAFKDANPIILGYIFGTIISIVSLKLISNTINKSVKKEASKAINYTRFHYMMRLFIYGLALVAATKADHLNMLSTGLGLTMVKNTIVLSTIFDKNFK